MSDALTITIRLSSCSQCRHVSHSGAFTPGGAKSICGHTCASKICGAGKDEPFHWKHRVVPATGIPTWCPLRSGNAY